MIVYLPGSKTRQMSELLWRQLGADRDGRMFPITQLTDGREVMVVETTAQLALANDANLGQAMVDILQPYIDAGHLPTDAIEILDSKVTQARGTLVVLWDLFPDFFKNMSMTREHLLAAGLLDELS